MRRFSIVAALAAVAAMGCTDAVPTSPEPASAPAFLVNKNRPGAPLVQDASGVLSDGGSFVGQVTVQRFDLNDAGDLVVTGLLSGTATTADGAVETLTAIPFSTVATLGQQGEMSIQQTNGTSCQILFLDVGPIFLDLLGLQLDLSQIVLDLSAAPGPGNLLGNLLCAVVHLLDGPALFSAIINLLEQINQLLGATG